MKISIYLFVLSCFLLTSCEKDEPLTDSSLVDNETAFIRVFESEDHINIYVESLQDTIDNRTEEYPLSDFCFVVFDINGNAAIDENIDFGFGSPTNDYDICSFYFIDSTTLTACAGFESEAIFTGDFIATEKNMTPHITWTLSIPKKDFSGTRSLDFIVKTYEPGIYRSYPEERTPINAIQFDFEKTMTVEW